MILPVLVKLCRGFGKGLLARRVLGTSDPSNPVGRMERSIMERLTRAVPHLTFSFLAAVCLVVEGGVTSASPIAAGLDFFATVSGAGGAEVDPG